MNPFSNDDEHASNGVIALGNYRGVATLVGDETLKSAIEDALVGTRLKRLTRPAGIRVIRWRDAEFLLVDDPEIGGRRRDDDADGFLRRMPRPRFAIWAPIYRKLYGYLLDLPSEWQLPEVPEALTNVENDDGGAVLPDGCALLPPWYEREEEIMAAPETRPSSPVAAVSRWDMLEEMKKQRDAKAILEAARHDLLIDKLTK